MRKLFFGFILLFFNQLLFTQTLPLTPGTVGIPQTICYNSAPAKLTQLTPPTGGTGSYSYQWQRSTNNTSWTNINGATASSYTPPTLRTNTWYRLRVTSGTSGTVSTNSVPITVYSNITSGTIGSAQTICYNTMPATLTQLTAPTGGTGSYTYQWQRSSNNSTWTNITGATAAGYSPETLTANTYFRRQVTSASCGTARSSSILIRVNGNLTAGSIGATQSICYNTNPAALTQVSAPTGGTGSYAFQWQNSPDNTIWSDINGATLSGYSPPALSMSTYFRRNVTSGACGSLSSGSILISVNPQITLAQLRDNVFIENNTSTNINVVISGGISPYRINYTRDGIAQSIINNYSSGSEFSTGVLTTGVFIYALTSVTDANGCSAQSLGTNITVTVSDNGNLTPGSIGTEQSVCYDVVPAPLTQITAPAGGTFEYTFQWQSSPDNTNWSDISGATLSGYSPSALSATTYFRRIVTSGSYTPVNSAPLRITVSPQITLAQLHDNITIYNNTSTNFNVLISGGTSPYRIEYTRNGAAQSAITNYSSGSNISTGVLAAGEFTYALTSVTDATGCAAQSLGTNIIVTVSDNGNLTAGSIGAAQSVCYNVAPAALTQITEPTGGNSTFTYQWQRSPDNTTWSDISGATLPGYSPPALSANTYFRRTVTSGSYTPVYSTSVLITIYPQITLAQLHDNISIQNNTSANINVILSGGTSPYTIEYTRNGVTQSTINNYSSGSDISTGVLTTNVFNYALTSVTDANGCAAQSLGTNITVTVTDNGNLTAGSIGTTQSVCYNVAPAPLTQITTPSGGTGIYTYQWQRSPDNTTWSDITGATLSGYSPPALSANTYFRCTVTSGSYTPVNTSSVLITIYPQITLAQLHDNISIETNTSTNINVDISGGTSPYRITYTRNGVAQSTINNYSSGSDIPTGVLTTGVFNYALTSVTDANGCTAQSLGTGITVTVIKTSGSLYVPVDSLFRAETPNDSYNDSRYELGSQFLTLSSGFITKARLFSHVSEGGDHIIRLWILNGSSYTLFAGPFTWNFPAGVHGWRQYTFASPIAVEANKTFIISISNGTDRNYERTLNFQSATVGSYVRYLKGTYSTVLGQVPTSTYSNSCYFRDIVFAVANANGNLTPGSIGAAQSVCYNVVPAPLTQITAPGGGTGAYTFQWQRSPDNTNWSNISGAILSGYSPSALSATTYFRRTVTSGSYTSVNSAPVRINVYPQITLAQLHDNITIYNNTSTNFNVLISGGTSPYRIEYTRNGAAQSAITNYSSGSNISTGVLAAGEFTYALTSVTDATGCAAQSLGTNIIVTVSDNGNLTAGSIGAAQSVCYNVAPAALTQITEPTGGNSTFTYQWQRSPDNTTWSDISGATLPGYSPPALSANTYFRRTVTSGSYTPVYSTSVLITIYPQITLAQLHDNISIQNNTSANINVILSGGTSPYTIEYTRNGVTQSTINNYSSGSDISTGVLTTNVFNYALTSVTDANGCAAQSLGTNITVTVTDNGNLTAGSIGTTQSVCYNVAPAPLTQITTPSGGTGIYTYQWQRSPDNTTWSDITGATLSGYSPPALSANTYFRCTVTSGSYTPVNTSSVLITIYPQITLAQLHDNISIETNTSTNINVDISGGTSPYRITYTRNGVAQSTINNYSSGSDIPTGVLTTGVFNYALTSVTDANGCTAQSLGTGITVTVIKTSGSLYVPVDSLFRAETPNDSYNDSRYELGSQFLTLSSGFITKARLFSHVSEGGDHIIRLWILNGSSYTLFAGPFTWNFPAGVHGWRQYTFASPIAVEANKTFIISISNGTDRNYERTLNFQSATAGSYVRYLKGTYSTVLGQVPTSTYSNSCYFRDIVFAVANANGNLTPGSIGAAQSVCYDVVPAPLTQIAAPTGGTGAYTFQWQRSPDNTNWSNISGATSSGYSPSALSATTYFRRTVISGSYTSVNSAPLRITVSPQITLAQLHDNITIYNNTSTNFNVLISGGTSPYRIEYTRNGAAQSAITNYSSGSNISTGVLTTGDFTYVLTSVTDATGCVAQSLGTDITVTVTDDQNVITNSNKALVVVNSASAYYGDYVNYIRPYLDNFGIPYDVCNINTTVLPDFTGFAVIIFGHKNVYSSGYPITQLETSIFNGVGLYSFDPHLFDYQSSFNNLVTQRSVNTNQITITNSTHYITQYHAPDVFNTTSNIVNLLHSWTVTQNSNLINGVGLADMSSSGQTVSLLQVSNYGNGKIVKWCGYDWVFENILGPIYGMDDLIWRGIVWAARKPFVIQGLPPMVTMRVDDAIGSGTGVTNYFSWLKICNEYGIIPWCGIFTNYVPQSNIPILKSLIDNNLATASPHAFWWNDFMFFNHDNITNPPFDAVARTRSGRDFFDRNSLKISKYFVPHYYEVSSEVLPEIQAMGGEFLGIHMPPDNLYYTTPWLNCGPYRINRNGLDDEARPVYYGDNINLSGINFFNCIVEIRDDGGYEWYPDNNIDITAARGIRHLKRSFNSMVLSTLFTHEYYFDDISVENWREIIRQVTSNLSEYNPEYKSIDYAIQYIRAKNNIKITSVLESPASIEISYSGSNDLDTKCYLFTEANGQITYRFVLLPQINGSNKVISSK